MRWLLPTLLLSACASERTFQKPDAFTSLACQKTLERTLGQSADTQLDTVSDLFNQGCFKEVINLGQYLRTQHRDKFYHLTTEAVEIVTPEGSFTDYVMESHERAYLSYLISLSYLRLNQSEASAVELRLTSEEQKAGLYNYGDDPISSLLLAAAWDHFDPNQARPYWKAVSESENADPSVAQFALKQIQYIDAHPNTKTEWQIEGYDYLPDIDWKYNFKNGPYNVDYKGAFPESCSDQSNVLASTRPWIDKLSVRYSQEYHPYLYMKSLVRIPFGIGYGLVGSVVGIAVGVGGCGIAAEAGSNGNDPLCQASLKAGGYIVQESVNLVDYTLKPDLRHWKKMPRAIRLNRGNSNTKNENTRETASDSACEAIRGRLFKTVQLSPVPQATSTAFY